MTIKDLLKEGADFLGDHENAILDCEVLLAYVLGKDKEYLLAHGNEEVEDDLVKLFEKYVERVRDGEPVAYITGEKEFYGLDFFVDKRVLVPRPETEMLVEKVLEYLRENEGRKCRVLDVGTGSGNIAVSVAKNSEDIEHVYAMDCEADALEVAKINVQQHGVEDKVYVCQSDLLDAIDSEERFDVIVANLPYIGEVKNRFVSADAEKYEPGVALFGGEDGLELYKKMFQQLEEKEVDYDLVVGEFGFAQREDMEKLLNKYFEQGWRIEKDLAGIDRIFVITK